MSGAPDLLATSRIFRFWLPLAGTWVMMAIESPLLTALIARLADPKPNLAAFGVAFAVAIIVESPVIMFMSASTALGRDEQSYQALRRFVLVLNAFITVVMVIVLVPAVFDAIAFGALRLPEDVARLTYGALFIMLPWPAAIGDRRFHQGLLIAGGLTRRVAYSTVVRLVSMGTTAFVCYRLDLVHGAHLGAWALSVGVVTEAIAVRVMARPVLAKLGATPRQAPPLTQREIVEFYTPLALTSMLAMSVQPMITFFMGQSRAALESLAVLPVIHGLTFFFRSFGLSYQEVAIALMGERGEHYVPLRRFALGLALATATGLVLLTWTPLGPLWFRSVAGLSDELTAFAVGPSRVISIVPALSVWLAFQRAILVHGRRTVPLGWATAAELIAIGAALAITVVGLNWIGAVAAMTAILLGRLVGNFILLVPCARVTGGFDPAPAMVDGMVARARL